MNISDLISPQAIVHGLSAGNKKKLIGELAIFAGKVLGREPAPLFEALWEREKLGSTGVGHGVAIPHARLSKLDKIAGFFALMEKPVDFESIDDTPVDLIFVLLTPTDAGADHLTALAQVSRMLRNAKTCERLRAATNETQLFDVLTEPPAGSQAA